MEDIQTKLIEKVDRLRTTFKWSKVIYPLLSSAYLLIIITLFALSARQITTLLNSIFQNNTDESVLLSLDRENYMIVSNKLGISVTKETISAQNTNMTNTATGTTTDKVSEGSE